MEQLSADYWNNRYIENTHRWDLGEISLPIKTYIDQLTDTSLKILIPGGGNSYKAEYLYQKGFTNVFVIDLAPKPLQNIKTRIPDFPEEQLILGDFFKLEDSFDVIIEQTFFCAIHPNLRNDYVKKAYDLLMANGKLVGLMFDAALYKDHPPFGGSKKEYQKRFSSYFNIKTMENCYNSHQTRKGRELFVNMIKKAPQF